ncbi:MAG: ARMT1-like domain-containing protein [Phycisphaerae bacterium]
MRTALDCIPCFLRQSLEAARFVSEDPALHERVLRDVLRFTGEMDMSQPPPVVGARIHTMLRDLTGNGDPYAAAKDRFNRMALDLLPALRRRVEESGDPFDTALRLAVAGNVVDLGVNGAITEQDVLDEIDRTLETPLRGGVESLRSAVADARSILYVADNAGEIVFDRLLIEQLPVGRVTLAVRGGPVINDATLDDARVAKLDDIADVVDTGSDCPGAVLPLSGRRFVRAFEQADVIISKGQGNFEGLSDAPGNVFFLLKAKCAVVASRMGVAVGTLVLLHSESEKPAGRHRSGYSESEWEKEQVKIAIPTVGGRLSGHFGRCEKFAIVDVGQNGEVTGTEMLDPPPHEPGALPKWLQQQGVDVVIAAGMGPRAQQMLADAGIEFVLGAAEGSVDELVSAYLSETLESGENACDH